MDNQTIRENESHVYDPRISGYNTSFWKTLAGSPIVSSNALLLNAAEIVSRASYRYADIEFSMTIPTAPTAGDARSWGLKVPSLGNAGRIEFNIADDVFSCKVYDETGASVFSRTVSWDAAWTNAATKFRIKTGPRYVEFIVGTTRVAQYEYKVNPKKINDYPLTVHAVNSNADAMSMAYMAVRDAASVSNANTDAVNVNVAGSSGGSASSGENSYMSPSDFTAAYASATTLTLTGIPFVPTNAQFISVKVQPASGVAVTYTPDSNAFSYASATGILTVTGAAFVNTDTYVVTLLGPKKAPYDSGSQSDRQMEVAPLNQQYVEETLVDSTNLAAGTVYYPSSAGLPMAGFSTLSIQGMTSGGVTTTIEATNDDAASPDWVDITKSFIDLITAAAGGASFVDVNFLLSPNNKDTLNVKAIRIKSVTSDATNAVQYNVRRIY